MSELVGVADDKIVEAVTIIKRILRVLRSTNVGRSRTELYFGLVPVMTVAFYFEYVGDRLAGDCANGLGY